MSFIDPLLCHEYPSVVGDMSLFLLCYRCPSNIPLYLYCNLTSVETISEIVAADRREEEVKVDFTSRWPWPRVGSAHRRGYGPLDGGLG